MNREQFEQYLDEEAMNRYIREHQNLEPISTADYIISISLSGLVLIGIILLAVL